MRRPVLALGPVALGAAYLAVYLVMGEAGDPAPLWFGARQLALGLAFLGCLLAAAELRPGEYLWLAWVATGLSYGLAVLHNLALGPDEARLLVPWAVALGGALDAALNAVSVFGVVLFALAYARGGLGWPGSRGLKAAVWGGAVALALLLGAPSIADSVRELTAGEGHLAVGLEYLTSAVGDVLCFAASAPLFLVALALRGSALAWAWWLLGASELGWLVSDWLMVAGHDAPALRGGARAVFLASALVTCSAALAHRGAVRAARAEARAAAGGPAPLDPAPSTD